MKNSPVIEFEGHRIRAVIFDAFGTLVYIGDKRRPYRKLLAMAERAGRPRQPDDAAKVMSMNCGMAGVAEWLNLPISLTELSMLEQDLYSELRSVRLYPEAIEVLGALKHSGLRIGICSNLATAYAIPISTLLPFELDAYAWSFEEGSVKPAPQMYQSVCEQLGVLPEEVLMVGDTYEADYVGPRQFGMKALPLVREGESRERVSIRSLDGVLEVLGIAQTNSCNTAFTNELLALVAQIVSESGQSAGFDAAEWLVKWMSTPVLALGGRAPVSLMATEEGRERIRDLIRRMQSGAFS